MKASPREIVLIVIMAAVLLFGGSFIAARPKWQRFGEISAEVENIKRTIVVDKRLVDNRAVWEKKFQELSRLLPKHPEGQAMDVHWRKVIGELAQSNGVKITEEEKSAPEIVLGELCEMPVERVSWEAELDAIIHFLFDIQTKDTMIDVRFLMIKPKRNSNELRGQFSVYCAYTRGTPVEKQGNGDK